jgi:hypothetical protein
LLSGLRGVGIQNFHCGHKAIIASHWSGRTG